MYYQAHGFSNANDIQMDEFENLRYSSAYKEINQSKQGVDFIDTYAPIVLWTAMCLMLTLLQLLDLKMKQVDYPFFCSDRIERK